MKKVSTWAQNLLKDPSVLILDVETTGLDADAEIVQVGVIDVGGNVMLDALLRPSVSIPAEATQVHGIRDEHVRKALKFGHVHGALDDLARGRVLVAYNAEFDRRMLGQTCKRYGLPVLDPEEWVCAMLEYAEYWGEWNRHHGDYRWQSLTDACHQQGIVVKDAHSGVGDCRLVLELLKVMAREE